MKMTTAIVLVIIGVVSSAIFFIAIQPYLDGEKDVADLLSEAEQFCLDHGGNLSLRSGNASICRFDSGYVCNVWEYYWGNCINPAEKNCTVENNDTCVSDLNQTG